MPGAGEQGLGVFEAAFFAVVLALVLYLMLWPVPIAPRRWNPQPDAGFVGPFAANRDLANLRNISLGQNEAPEHIAFGPDGKLYASALSGDIVRMNADGTDREIFVNTGGRTLGFAFDSSGRLIAADAMRGLIAISIDRSLDILCDAVEGDPIRYANAVSISGDGRIYVSDSSRRFSPRIWGGTFEASVLDILEQAATGRVLVHDPIAKTTRTIASGLSFANGVALSGDERSLFVCETGKYRIWKIPVAARDLDLSSGPSGGATILLDNLPGFPDNLMRGLPLPDGRPKIWVGFAKPRNAILDRLGPHPFLRKIVQRTPRALQPIPKTYGHVAAFDVEGNILASLQDPEGAYPETTGATETHDRLYIMSLHAKAIGWRDGLH